MKKCLSRQKPSCQKKWPRNQPHSWLSQEGSRTETLDELKSLLMSNPRPAVCQCGFLPELRQTLTDVAQNRLGMARSGPLGGAWGAALPEGDLSSSGAERA